MNLIAPLTHNQHNYLLKTFNSWFNVAEGGKRGGKNVLNTLAFAIQLEEHPNKLHLVGAVSLANVKLNVFDCDGFGLINYFEGRCREGEYKNKAALYIGTRTGEKIVIAAGGGKNGDEKFIKGNSYGMVYLTEANECHENFIREAFDRTIASKNRKIFHDLNPKGKAIFIIKKFLVIMRRKQAIDNAYGYNYGHFAIKDNLSLTQKQVNEVLKTYDKNDVWYLRDILGLRKAAEGAVYPTFIENKNKIVINKAPQDIGFSHIGVDFGGNGSAHSFVLTGFSRDLKTVTVLDEWYHKGVVTPTFLEQEFIKFCKKNARFNPVAAYMDSTEQVLIQGIRISCVASGLKIAIKNAVKGLIIDRIRFYNMLHVRNAYRIMAHCENLIEAFETAVYNSKIQNDERLDDGSSNIDSLDAAEYSTEPLQKQILQLIGMGGGDTK